MAKVVSETLKIAFQNANFKMKGGVGFNFQAMNQQPAVNIVEKCIQYGPPVVALYVAGKLLQHSWSWINLSETKSEDELRVSVTSDQEEEFRKLVKSEELSRRIQQGFNDLEGSLKEILGEQVFGEVGQKVLELIGKVRVKSVERKEPDLPKNMTAMNVVHGTVNQKIHNKHDLLVAGKNGEGPIVGNYAGAGANLTQEIHGGGFTMAIGVEGDDLNTITNTHKELAGDYIELRIKVTERRKYFEGKFQRKQTINEVVWAIEDKFEGTYRISRGNKQLDGGMTIAEAERESGEWEAKQVTKDTKNK